MKRLILVRHGKSSWKNPGLPDKERPLNKRGQRDAPIMAARLASICRELDCAEPPVFSSPAIRAQAIAKVICDGLNKGREQAALPHLWESLYTFSGSQLEGVLAALPDDKECCIVVGHNPALTDCANELIASSKSASDYIENIPTSGVVVLECDIASWKNLSLGCAKLIEFDYPKCELKEGLR